MTKLTKEQIKEMIEMKDKFPVIEIINKFNIQKGTFYHHTNPEYREKVRQYQKKRYNNLSIEEKKIRLNKSREFQKNYHKNRYKNDEEFRKKQIERVGKK